MAKHAELSPSSAATWMRCPAAIQAQRGIPNKSSQYSDEGNAAHFVAAWCLQNNAAASACEGREVVLWEHPESSSHGEDWRDDFDRLIEGEPTLVERNRFTVDEEMVDAVQIYLDTVRTYAQHGQLFVEVRVPIGHITTEEDAEGTSDTIILTHDLTEIIVIDLKYGMGVQVYAEENEQMQMYALGALEWLDIAGLADQVKRVRLVISQPRKSDTPSEWDLPIEDLRKFGVRANLAAVQGLTSESPVFNPGKKQCRWCRAKATCAAAEREAIGTVIDDFDIVGSDKDRVQDKLEIAAFNTVKLSNERLGYLMGTLDFIEDWCRAIRASADAELLRGNEVPGYKLVEGKRGARKWADAEEAEAALKGMRLKADEMYTKKVISPTQAEKVLKKSPAKFEKLLPLITQSEGAKSVVPVSDPRPAIVIKPRVDEFQDLTEEEPLA